MDPRVSWHLPEVVGTPAHELWARLWERHQDSMFHLNNNPNLDKQADFIPLDITNNFTQKQGLSNKQNSFHNQQYQARKKENKASTFGLNHSSKVHHLKDGGLIPWIPRNKSYSPGAIG